MSNANTDQQSDDTACSWLATPASPMDPIAPITQASDRNGPSDTTPEIEMHKIGTIARGVASAGGEHPRELQVRRGLWVLALMSPRDANGWARLVSLDLIFSFSYTQPSLSKCGTSFTYASLLLTL